MPSSSLLPDAPNLLFTNAGMNQFVPIFLGQQKPPWNPPRAADTQKCIRAGGKHNDLEDVGLDTYHHTFFEMLGNWSFGDYFKKEAIEWAWELVVERWKFPPQRLYATVYKPGPDEPREFDQEAHDHWARLFREADLDPAIHIVNGNKKDNFWMMGDTGPCGPCSELHVDLTPDGDTNGSLVNTGRPALHRDLESGFHPVQRQRRRHALLRFRTSRRYRHGFRARYRDHSGHEKLHRFFRHNLKLRDRYFSPDLRRDRKTQREKIRVDAARNIGSSGGESEQEKIDIAFRVIADHIRTLSFAIADGIIPSNEGRGYVLRRILRRAVRYGRTLAFTSRSSSNWSMLSRKRWAMFFPKSERNRTTIQETIQREEEAFNKTLDRGTKSLRNV